MANKKKLNKRPTSGWYGSNLFQNSWVWIGIGWPAAFLGVLALLNFHPIIKTELTVSTPLPLVWILFSFGLACLVAGYRRLPTQEAPDLNRKEAWIILTILMAGGACLRLYRAGHPPGPFWDDWATNFVWVHQMLDKNLFFWMMPSDGIEPFVPYVLAAVMGILPEEVRDLIVRRISSTLIDLTAIWVLYLCGKELGSRRIGIFAAGLAAFGRPMLQLTVTGMRAFSLSLAVGLLILSSLKLFRKPSLKHFLWWGAALAFGAHTYSSFRVFMLAVPFLLLPWIFREQGKLRIHPAAWAGALGSVFLLMGVYSGTFSVTFPWLIPWGGLWDRWSDHGWGMLGLFALCLGPSLYLIWLARKKETIPPLAGWALAVGLACVLIYPMTISDEFNGRMAVLSPFRDDKASQNIFLFLAGQCWQTIKSLFYACLDRNDLTIGTDPYFDLYSQGALLLGLGYFLARPDWKKAYLAVLAALGTVVYIISFDPASTKLIAAAAPLYLLSAWAVSGIWSGLRQSVSRHSWTTASVLFISFLAFYAVWGAGIQFKKIFGVWAKIPMVDTVLADCVEADEKNERVYVAPSDYFFGWNAQTVLNEGRRYYILKDSNSIPADPSRAPENVVVFVYGTNQPMIERLHREFPKAWWEKIYVFPHSAADPNPELYMWRVSILGTEITRDAKAVLHWEEQAGPWLRRYYNHSFGWGLSGILRESRVPIFADPINKEWLTSDLFKKFRFARLLQMMGAFEAPQDGEYIWMLRFPQPLWLRVDGETLWKQDGYGNDEEVTFRKYFKKGIHAVEMRARFPMVYEMPEIRWKGEWEGATDHSL